MDDKNRYACTCQICERVEACSRNTLLVNAQLFLLEHLTKANVPSKICDVR